MYWILSKGEENQFEISRMQEGWQPGRISWESLTMRIEDNLTMTPLRKWFIIFISFRKSYFRQFRYSGNSIRVSCWMKFEVHKKPSRFQEMGDTTVWAIVPNMVHIASFSTQNQQLFTLRWYRWVWGMVAYNIHEIIICYNILYEKKSYQFQMSMWDTTLAWFLKEPDTFMSCTIFSFKTHR